jgi:L,D-transpeptidase YcbB
VKALTPLLLTLCCAGCFYLKEPSSATNNAPKIVTLDTSLFADTSLVIPASVREVYRLTNYSLLWSDTSGFTKRADSLIEFIGKVRYCGLIPEHYHVNEITRELLQPDSDQRLIRIDVWLTDGYLALSNDLKNGRIDPKTLELTDIRNKIDSGAIDFLYKHAKVSSVFEPLRKAEPVDGLYLLMKDSLAKLLNTSAADSLALNRINKLTINMERMRWKAVKPDRYIDVNIPGYQLEVIEGDSIFLESKIIVGKPETPTPLLESRITSFLIYPYWHVPRSIATLELLPLIQNDSTYLSKHNYEVLDQGGNVVDPSSIEWTALDADHFPFVLRQREGTDNALGIIKFLFNNRYGVYLHDTNGRRLFSRSMRALSHGCVRVHKARELARYLVRDDSVYVTPDDVDQYLALQQRLQVKIPRAIPLVMRYFTAGKKDGTLVFYDDIYGQDELLRAKLSGSRKPQVVIASL